LSFALVQQGIEPIHATAVTTGCGAIAFLGDSGDGKSTLGAAFLKAGFRLLTDDLLITRLVGGRMMAFPGPPRIKLFPEMARNILGPSARGTPMHHLTAKMIIPLSEVHCDQPVPLRALYALTFPPDRRTKSKTTIRRLSRRAAFLNIVRNTFNCAVSEPQRLERHFRIATELASHVPVKLLSYPMDHRLLPRVRDAVIADANRA
jgi:hypothetical protein